MGEKKMDFRRHLLSEKSARHQAAIYDAVIVKYN